MIYDMEALDGKITIERELRPCIVHIPQKVSQSVEMVENYVRYGKLELKNEEYTQKALFHFWSPATGKAIVEYSDGTIHEVEPTQVRFVDNAMSEYVFPEMED